MLSTMPIRLRPGRIAVLTVLLVVGGFMLMALTTGPRPLVSRSPFSTPSTDYNLYINTPHNFYINTPLDLTTQLGRKSRSAQVQHACRLGTGGNTQNILVYEHSPSVRMSYCVVPKAGCTFWIRVFRFLNNDTDGRIVRTPWEIDRQLAHDTSRRTMHMYRLQNEADIRVIKNSTRFMFARDPFTRLWSAYVDKLLLPNYWLSTGRTIVARRRNATRQSKECGHDVSFREFVEYIVHEAKTEGAGSLDGHWRPVQYVCDPCRFQPHFVGKQETFLADADAILGHMGLRHVLAGYDATVHARDEVAILVRYNLGLVKGLPPLCIDSTGLAKLLWRIFQINGHLSPLSDATSLDALPHNVTAEQLISALYGEMERVRMDRKAAALARRLALVHAYRQVPLPLLQKLVSIYDMDFEYFGYDRNPNDIFGV